MNSRIIQNHQFQTNSHAIRQEIQRFESVHPSIYAIYDLIEAIPDLLVQQQIREHVICIEDSFVNSQEWTLSRAVPDLKLGILGTVNSGKSALVHRYLTGTYLQEESPEGGRFKKEVVIDGQSYLLLVRDEGGLPELQFTQWVDAVVFVFSLENELSFNAIYSYFAKMAHHYHATATPYDIPIILVGTQDAISESNPRIIDDARARKLASDLKRCAYYETCATYGLNVERVFQDACQKILQSRASASTVSSMFLPPPQIQTNPILPARAYYHQQHQQQQPHQLSSKQSYDSHSQSSSGSGSGLMTSTPFSTVSFDDSRSKDLHSLSCSADSTGSEKDGSTIQLLVDTRDEEKVKTKNSELGSGRTIPIKQGILSKKSSKPLKEWKKKYVTLLDDGRLTYHPSLHDYMENVKGKEINLLRTTVKIPGHRPKGAEQPREQFVQDGGAAFDPGFGILPSSSSSSASPLTSVSSTATSIINNNVNKSPIELPNNKKKTKRPKGTQGHEDAEMAEFTLVSLDNTSWHFQAQSIEERDDWVMAIEQQIFSCLQSNMSDKSRGGISTTNDKSFIQRIRCVKGNNKCADCDAPNPDWASLNLGTLICIECSGIHRNLGTHLSRVRSLDLDEWPNNLVLVMTSIGNQVANSIWEANLKGRSKPDPFSNREEKEKWIRSKYGTKEFLAHPPYMDVPLPQQLIDAIARQDVHNTILVLAYCSPEQVNTPYSITDTRRALHIAAALANLVLIQLLLWHGANANLIDHEGYNPLFYARSAGSVACTELLRMYGSSEGPTLPRRRPSNTPSNSSYNNQASNHGEAFEKLPSSVL